MIELEDTPAWIEEVRKTLEYRIEVARLDFVHEVWHLMEARRVSKAELARRVGRSPAWVTQLFDCNVNPTLEMMVKIAAALEADVTVKLNERRDSSPGSGEATALEVSLVTGSD